MIINRQRTSRCHGVIHSLRISLATWLAYFVGSFMSFVAFCLVRLGILESSI